MRAFQGAVGVSPSEGIVSTDYAVLRMQPEFEPRFVHHLFRSHWFVGEMSSRLRGIGTPEQGNVRTPRINVEDLGDIRIAWPPLAEQRVIADFLDRETARIDALLERKHRMADLVLQRHRRLIVQATVTGEYNGPPPSPKHDWSSSFPATWQRVRLRNLVAEVRNGTWGEEPEVPGEGIACVRAADFDRVRHLVSQAQLPRRTISSVDLSTHRLAHGDIVLEKSGGGDNQPVGAAVTFDLPVDAVATNFAARVRPAQGIDSRFLCYVLAATYELGLNQRSIKQTTGLQNLDTQSYLSEPWAVPPLELQESLVRGLDARTRELDELRASLGAQCELVLEHRAALISAAVTGQIEVRGVTASTNSGAS